jgi:histidyl-tRNA synthetase
VRGLSYYTGIVFEAFDRRGVLRAIAGGGRCDHLFAEARSHPPCTPSITLHSHRDFTRPVHRYDNLLSKLATEDEGSPVGWTIPMCGFGFGDCVIVELLAENNQMPPFAKAVDAVVAPYDASMVSNHLTPQPHPHLTLTLPLTLTLTLTPTRTLTLKP